MRVAVWTGGWDHPENAGMQQTGGDINRGLPGHPGACGSRTPAGFEWIDANDSAATTSLVVALVARNNEPLVCPEASAVPDVDYRVGPPVRRQWTEIVNTDAAEYGGSGVGNPPGPPGGSRHGRPASACRSRYRRSASSGCATRG